jgi:hypothetical protein
MKEDNFAGEVVIVLAFNDNCFRSFLVVSCDLCTDSTEEFSETECDPCDPASGERFLGRYCLVEEFLDNGYLQEYNSTGEY